MKLDDLIETAQASGGSEMANAQLFIERLTDALGLPQPNFAGEENQYNDYVFERRVDFKHPDGSTTSGRIDCYKRDCFILEAKQSAKRKTTNPNQLEMLGEDARQQKSGHAKRGTKQWDVVMRAARKQAEDYAKALPVEHGYPPFLLVVDVGNVIEVFADFSGQGKNYAHFPDRKSFRIAMEDLREADIQERLTKIWTDPQSLNPAAISAKVTRDIAARLAKIAKRLEGKHDPRDVAEFLMRCLFTMFAEDVGLLPKASFADLLEELHKKPDTFVPQLEHLWKTMDEGGFEPRMGIAVKRFNGLLFKTRKALPLDADGIHELWVAAKQDWRDVEPAIFGTLLERALDPRERSKLGAHYTPRAYVERLVIPTIIEPLREDWEDVQARAAELREAGKMKDAIKAVKAFHHTLCITRVLDPACGTGNFLYVSLELMKRLEGDVLDALDALGEDAPKFAMEGETVGPRQFYGLEINPRAEPIADLVLWIGYLKWQLKTVGAESITEPVLDAYGTIKKRDAILAYDKQEMLRDENGKPLSRWDGVTKKLHPITGEEIPDPDATLPLYSYSNPRPAKWPEVEFIVGNPPFIGGKDMRAELGDGYAEACWKARKHMPGGADFVMHFWDEAAVRLARKVTKKEPNPLRRFGFITTNSITQTFSRRVVEKALSGKQPVSLVFAVPDHPWLKASDKAAVRIAMTVVEKGEHDGVLGTVAKEEGLNTDTPEVRLDRREGKVTAKLTLGADLSKVEPLLANEEISSAGVKLHGAGFIVDPNKAKVLGYGIDPEVSDVIYEYRNGRDITQRPRGVKVIDLFGLKPEQVSRKYPAIHQHVLDHVKPERDQNNRKSYRENWWVFGEPRAEMRPALETLPRYITTVETSKHRFFQFLDASIRPDNRLVNIGVERADLLTILTSRPHVQWTLSVGGVLEDRPIYTKTSTFDPFPFPACLTDDSNPDLRDGLAELGERLDAHRKDRLERHEFLTMTGMYNVLERVRELEWVGRQTPAYPLRGGRRSEADAGGGAELAANTEGDADCDTPNRNGSAVSQGRATGLDPSSGPPQGGGGESAEGSQQEPLIPPLTDKERDIYEAGLIGVLKEIHDEIDRATFEAYGWGDLGARLVGRPGATMPSPHKSEDQEQAEEELLARLVALNIERREEEKRGHVRWLRPDYQIPKLGHKVTGEEQAEADLAIVSAAEQPKWPKDGLDQIRLVKDVLAKAPEPAIAFEISASFAGNNSAARKKRVAAVLETLVATGAARTGQIEGEVRYFVPR
ncbi:MAG: class I SAM-dependent DNA methyltransferase [Ahrensia sp.]|nr:class I SAM-dependent DNA methyltransferase [Ahrensia sp.]